MRNLVAMRQMKTKLRCLKPHRPYTVDFAIDARERVNVTDFDRKGITSGVRVQSGLYLDMLDADRSPNAVSVHAGTSQVDFEVDSLPPAPPGHILITMVKEAVFCTKNDFQK